MIRSRHSSFSFMTSERALVTFPAETAPCVNQLELATNQRLHFFDLTLTSAVRSGPIRCLREHLINLGSHLILSVL